MQQASGLSTLQGALDFDRYWMFLLRRDTRHLGFFIKQLQHQNRTSNALILSPDGPIVSLTTYGVRLATVYLTIESIARGAVRPSRLILWLDDCAPDRCPDDLKRLAARGLEILMTDNFGPHKKYYPYVQSTEVYEQPLITADDDVLYPRDWLDGLVTEYRRNPSVIHCWRAHVMGISNGAILPYLKWKNCSSSETSFLHFWTGVSGSAFPPALLRQLRAAGTSFRSQCPTADDIWLHANALRAGLRVKQIKRFQRNFPELPGSQAGSLCNLNVVHSWNDAQIAMTYTAEDLALLKLESLSLSGSRSAMRTPGGGAELTAGRQWLPC
jgi:hypothetical protein